MYLAKNGQINDKQLVDSIKRLNMVAYSTTLYMNNSSFKNMQSSGLYTYIEEGELKHTLATYYEVDFKSIEAVNEFFDQVGTVFNNYLPIGLGKLIRESQNFSKDFVTNDKDGFQDFILSLDKTKSILKSDEFIYEVQKYYNYLFIYRTSLLKTKKRNETLINY